MHLTSPLPCLFCCLHSCYYPTNFASGAIHTSFRKHRLGMDDTKNISENVHFIPFEMHTSNPNGDSSTPPLSSAHEGDYIPSDAHQTKNKFDRLDVVNAFHQAFILAGGTERLVQHANEDYKDFIKHYAKLLPSSASSALGETTDITINHNLPRTALDQ